jgi:hypothetical protein
MKRTMKFAVRGSHNTSDTMMMIGHHAMPVAMQQHSSSLRSCSVYCLQRSTLLH